MQLSRLLAFKRKSIGWTIRDLEDRTGIPNSRISRIETGDTEDPGFSDVVNMARVMNISMDTLVRCVPRRK